MTPQELLEHAVGRSLAARWRQKLEDTIAKKCQSCTQPAAPAHSRCQGCLEISRRSAARSRKTLISKKLCLSCRNKAAIGRRYCDTCRRRVNDKYRSKQRAYRKFLKDQTFAHYGGYVCACCGERREPFLALDHINGGGKKHLKEVRTSGYGYHLWLRRNNYPRILRVLCHNCNMGRALNKGVCPHEEERKAQVSS